MKWTESPFGKVWQSISRYGLNEGLRNALARWSRQRLRISHDVTTDYSWILNPDRPAALPSPARGPLTINWIIAGVGEASGGLRTICRVVQFLEKAGHHHRIYVLDSAKRAAASANELLRRHYFPLQTLVEPFRGTVEDCDALVATLWNTAYAVRGLPNTARKFYFVQDLEHLFYPAGSISQFAAETYNWGFYGITVGQWVADVLHRDFGMECSSFGLSYDPDVYTPEGPCKLPRGRKRVLFYARPSSERRGFELAVLALSLVARRMPEAEFVLVGAPMRKSELPFPAHLPGVVSAAELASWYRSCSAALVLSHSNLSLVPLEAMACGCPVVSNTGPNVEWLLTREATQLAHPTPRSLANAILQLLEDDDFHFRKAQAGLALARQTSWNSEIQKVEAAFYRGLGLSLESEAEQFPRPSSNSASMARTHSILPS